MAQVTLENVSKMFDEVVAVREVNLTVQDKEFVVLVGPSGCGKSTTLRMIAGLEEITSGTIKIGERVVNDGLKCGASERRTYGLETTRGEILKASWKE
jgi:multiple sugar transport system ATP-binding protein